MLEDMIVLMSDECRMEGMESTKAIDDDIFRNIATFKSLLGVECMYTCPMPVYPDFGTTTLKSPSTPMLPNHTPVKPTN